MGGGGIFSDIPKPGDVQVLSLQAFQSVLNQRENTYFFALYPCNKDLERFQIE